ncbi:hypothetical protein SAMN05518801_11090 [Novosphingobium sp. CF614]|nr:hypothetical protein SAMN05518801_11090 [Novosphingobium sp. CF614]
MVLVGEGAAAEDQRRILQRAGALIVGEGSKATLAVVVDDPAAVSRLKVRGALVYAVGRPELCDFTPVEAANSMPDKVVKRRWLARKPHIAETREAGVESQEIPPDDGGEAATDEAKATELAISLPVAAKTMAETVIAEAECAAPEVPVVAAPETAAEAPPESPETPPDDSTEEAEGKSENASVRAPIDLYTAAPPRAANGVMTRIGRTIGTLLRSAWRLLAACLRAIFAPFAAVVEILTGAIQTWTSRAFERPISIDLTLAGSVPASAAPEAWRGDEVSTNEPSSQAGETDLLPASEQSTR